MTAYIIKSSVSLLLLFGLYWFLLRKEKLFVFNRFFLIASVVFSLVIPFISIPVNFQTASGLESFVSSYDQITTEIIPTDNAVSDSVNINQSYFSNISVILYVLYFSGVILLLFRFLRNLYIITQKSRISEKIFLRGYRVVLTNDQTGPCCFFDRIFLNREDYQNGKIDKDLLNHEMEHARQFHSIDIILIELVKVFYWFNPINLLYERAIRINHEYLADNVVISDNSDIKSYTEKLLNYITCSSNMSLTSGSNNSFTKMRLMMMMKSHSGNFKYGTRIAITLCMVSIFFILLSFKETKNQSSETNLSQTGLVNQQNLVKGIVLGEDGKPVMLVTIIVAFPGNAPTNIGVQSDSDGRFELKNIQKDASLLVSGIGYKNQILKPDFNSEMVITMVKDPNYKMGVRTPDLSYYHEGENVRIRMIDDKNLQSLIVIDEKINNNKGEVTLRRDDVGLVKVLKAEEATNKYGEKGKNGVIEITTKKRAAELGLNTSPPASALKQTRDPYDFPTFQGGGMLAFQEWVANRVKYPEVAKTNNIEGWVSVNYTVNTDGSISNITSTLPINSILSNEVIRVIKSSPKWEPPKNKDTGKPFNSTITFKFKLPDNIIKDAPYVVVEEMPMYPGGESELLNFIKINTKYPDEAKTEKVEGRVIVRFIITTEGNAEGISVLKSINPLLDAEAIRVASLLKGWKPGIHEGKPVNTWYMIPVNFAVE